MSSEKCSKKERNKTLICVLKFTLTLSIMLMILIGTAFGINSVMEKSNEERQKVQQVYRPGDAESLEGTLVVQDAWTGHEQENLLDSSTQEESDAEGTSTSSENAQTSSGNRGASISAGKDQTSSRPSSVHVSSNPVQTSTSSSAVSSRPSSGSSQNHYGGRVRQSGMVGVDYFDDAVFLGDSHIYGLSKYGIFQNAVFGAKSGISIAEVFTTAVSYGSGQKLMKTIVEEQQPKKIYIMLGTNGTGYLQSAQFIDYYNKLVKALREVCPGAQIYAHSVLPFSNKCNWEEEANNRIRAYNRKLETFCEQNRVAYLPVNEIYMDEFGRMDNVYGSGDGIHLKQSSYADWCEFLLTHTV